MFILADDLSKHDVGCYGNSFVRTPNIDRIASEGMRFNRAFTPTAMCAPARTTLYTGLYPHRHGCHMNHGATNENIKTLPTYLTDLGYRVGLAGKKHIKPEHLFPFEYLSSDMKAVERFVAGKNSPFCLIFASDEPHSPHEKANFNPDEVSVPPYKVDTLETRKRIAGYYTDIELLDKETGDLMNMLERQNLSQNTMVIFASDHGYELFAKWTCYEAGLNIPFIVKWPGKVKPGSTSEAMISLVDFVPTALEVAGGAAPQSLDGRSFKDVLIQDKSVHHAYIYGCHTNRGIWSGETYPIRSVRNERYKYIRNLYPEGKFTCIPTNGWNYNEADAGPVFSSWKERARYDTFAASRARKLQKRPAEELYDLEQDPYELENLIDKPELKQILFELRNKLNEWMKQQGDLGLESELKVPKKQPRD